MADLSVDATSSGTGSVTSSITFSHTVTSTGKNVILIVGTGDNSATDANRPINSITYAGTNLTKIKAQDDATNNLTTEVWYLLKPATGANDIVITAAGTVSQLDGCGLSLTGASDKQADVSGGSSPGPGTSVSTTVTTVENRVLVMDAVFINQTIAVTLTANAGQTEQVRASQTSALLALSTKDTISSPGSVTMGWTKTGAGTNPSWTHVVVGLKPFFEVAAWGRIQETTMVKNQIIAY